MLLQMTDSGLYCAAGDFYVDPWHPGGRAVVTHGHADHTNPGSQHYLGASDGLHVLHQRLGPEPHTIDAVMIYAQRGSGRRTSLYSDYTFAVWDNGELVPFAKAYSGLTDTEMRQVDAFVRRNTRERFCPVRSVAPQLVFELGFEAIQRSSRHKSGMAVSFPRILRWRHDKSIEEADTLATLKAMLPDAKTPGDQA